MTYFFACGGTGGHIFPALATAEVLRGRNRANRVFFICGKREVESVIFQGVPKESVCMIESAPFRGIGSFVDPRFLLKLTQGFFDSRNFMKKNRPRLVVGFGGYVSFPAILAAKSLGCPTALHEQNVIPGRANRVLARWVGSVAISFEESKKYFGKGSPMTVTGNPVRSFITRECREEAFAFFGFSKNKKTLLVLGGSQGAESVNRIFLSSLAYLSREMKDRIQVLHLCGRMLPSDSERACAAESIVSKAFSFFDRMDLAYAVTDFCLGRAGATFLAEIASKNLPAILIPYPYAGAHQKENANIYARNHAALLSEQVSTTPQSLAQLIEKLFQTLSSSPVRAKDSAKKCASLLMADFVEACARRSVA